MCRLCAVRLSIAPALKSTAYQKRGFQFWCCYTCYTCYGLVPLRIALRFALSHDDLHSMLFMAHPKRLGAITFLATNIR